MLIGVVACNQYISPFGGGQPKKGVYMKIRYIGNCGQARITFDSNKEKEVAIINKIVATLEEQDAIYDIFDNYILSIDVDKEEYQTFKDWYLKLKKGEVEQAEQPNKEDIILKNDILVVRIKTLVSCYNRWKKIAKNNDSCGDFVKEYQYQLEAILNLINAMGIWTSYSQDCNDYIYKVMIGKQKIDCSDCIPE